MGTSEAFLWGPENTVGLDAGSTSQQRVRLWGGHGRTGNDADFLGSGCAPGSITPPETIPSERRASWRIHRVAEGDTLESIARRYNMTVSAIASANSTTQAELGDVLVIPTASQIDSQVSSDINGHVTRIDPAVDGAVRVTVTPTEPTSIAPGTSVDATIGLDLRQHSVRWRVIPDPAVCEN